MFIFRGTLAMSLALTVTTALLAAPNQPRAARGRQTSSNRGIEGTIVQIHHARSPRGAGWVKIRRVAHHRGGRTSAAAAVGRGRSRHRNNLHTVHVKGTTRFARIVQGANGQSSTRLTSFTALRRGERVRILTGSGGQQTARMVNILSNNSRGRRSNGSGSAYGSYSSTYGRHYGHRRHSLVGRGGRSGFGGSRYYSNRSRVTRVTVIRPVVRHTLIAGDAGRRSRHRDRDDHRHTVAHPSATKTVKHTGTAHKTAPKHSTAPKPAAHKATAHHTNPKPAHSAGHAKPHAPAHRKR